MAGLDQNTRSPTEIKLHQKSRIRDDEPQHVRQQLKGDLDQRDHAPIMP